MTFSPCRVFKSNHLSFVVALVLFSLQEKVSCAFYGGFSQKKCCGFCRCFPRFSDYIKLYIGLLIFLLHIEIGLWWVFKGGLW